MSLILHKPHYSRERIRQVGSLAAALGLHETALRELAVAASGMYRRVPHPKREIFDAHPPLKRVQGRVKTSILERVYFPEYLTGSLRGKDYKANAEIHSGQLLVICEDVKGFFPSVTRDRVEDIWRGFFGFSADVAELLTCLTTKDGQLPQGARTSSYLANLVLWRKEPLLEAKFRARSLRYSRYVDDITVSAGRHLSSEEQSWVIAQVYGMLQSEGLRAGRSKHEVHPASRPMRVTKLIVNEAERPSLGRSARAKVRAALFQLERELDGAPVLPAHIVALNKLAQRIGQVGRFHKGIEVERLKQRAAALRERMTQSLEQQQVKRA